MKQIICIVLALCFCLCAMSCGGGSVNPDTAQSSAAAEGTASASPSAAPTSATNAYNVYDYRQNVIGGGTITAIVETADSVYVSHQGYLYFSDKEYKEFMPLCGKPDCMHNDRDCNAYLDAINFTVYGDYIYCLDTYYIHHTDELLDFNENLVAPSLCRARLDGSQHEKLLELPVPEVDFNMRLFNYNGVFSNKYLFATFQTYDSERGESLTAYYVIDLDTLKVKEVDVSGLGFSIGNGGYVITGEGDLLYMYTGGAEASSTHLCVLDMANGVITDLCKMPTEANVQDFCFYLKDGALYSVHYLYDSAEIKLKKCDVSTGEITTLNTSPLYDAKAMSFDWSSGSLVTRYVRFQPDAKYTRPDWGLYAYDTDMNLIDCTLYGEDEEGEALSIIAFLFQTESYIFGVTAPVGSTLDASALLPDWYIDKSEIGTGHMTWHRWEP